MRGRNEGGGRRDEAQVIRFSFGGGRNIGAGGGGGGTFNNLHAKTILITRILVSAGGWFTQVQKNFKLDTILK